MSSSYFRRHGSLIIAAILLFSLLLVLGIGLMSSQVSRRKAVNAEIEAIQAKSLALSAWDDVRVKLGKDTFFPNVFENANFYSYSEDVYDSDLEYNDADHETEYKKAEEAKGKYIGSYTVVVDYTYAYTDEISDEENNPNKIRVFKGVYCITCIGKVGERGQQPRAERMLYFELASDTFEVIRMHDWGAP